MFNKLIIAAFGFSLLVACQRGSSHAQADTGDARQNVVKQEGNVKMIEIKKLLPDQFLLMNQTSAVNGSICAVGAELNDEGAESANVIFVDSSLGKVNWKSSVEIQEGMYQNRATHCVCSNEICYALIAQDTQPAQSLSQTLLSVAGFSVESGRLLGVNELTQVPSILEATKNPVSMWVQGEASNFTLHDGKLLVRGKYREMEGEEDHLFETTLLTNFTEAGNHE